MKPRVIVGTERQKNGKMTSHRGENRRKIKLQSRALILIALGNEGGERGSEMMSRLDHAIVFSPSQPSHHMMAGEDRLDLTDNR